MRAFVDTEFNGYGGDLISIAIVPEEPFGPTNTAFYAVIQWNEQDLDPWVREHVIPRLAMAPDSRATVKKQLWSWLEDNYQIDTFVADWPIDLAHLLALLEDRDQNGIKRLRRAFNFHLMANQPEKYAPLNPHNALSDAYALRRAVRDMFS